MKAAVYLRQSEDRDDDQLAISRQREDCHKLCAARGWDPVDYVDNDVSAVGAKRKRPAWNQLLDDIGAGTVQAVVCWDLDRLYREPIDLEYLIPLADRTGTALATVTGDVDLSTDNGRMIARIKGAVARAEVDRRSARQKRKGLQLAEAGENWGPRRPLGYERDGSIVAHEAAAIAEAYNLVLSGHHSLMSICRMWNQSGFRTSLGNPWRHQGQLGGILLNPRYAGLRSYNGRPIGPAKWPAIVQRDVWEAVHDILTDPSRFNGKTRARRYLLVGIARCGGRCEENGIVSTVDAVKGVNRPSYRCSTCFGISKVIDRVDDQITRLVVARLSRPDAAELLVDQKHPDLDKLRSEAAAAREKLRSIAVRWAEDLMTDEQADAATRRAKQRLAVAESAMQDANRARLFKGVVGEEAYRFPGLHLDRRRAIIDGLITVTLRKSLQRGQFDEDSIVVDWKVPS